MSMGQDDAVAIVGFGGIFPGSADLERFWANIVGGVDATREVPPGRWMLDPAGAFDPEGRRARPGLLDPRRLRRGFRLDLEGLDLDLELVDRLDPMFHLALHAAAPGLEIGADRGDRSPARRRHLRQHRPADRDVLGVSREILGRAIERGLGRSGVGRRDDRAAQRLPGRPAGGARGAGARARRRRRSRSTPPAPRRSTRSSWPPTSSARAGPTR